MSEMQKSVLGQTQKEIKLCGVAGCCKKLNAKGLCKFHYNAEYTRNNRERIRQKQAKYNVEHREERKLKNKLNVRALSAKKMKWNREHPDKARAAYLKFYNSQKGKWRTYKTCAKYRGVSWGLSFEEFCSFWKNDCYYCGLSIETIGIDRIDSMRGYEMENLVPCCSRCNISKNKMSQREFLDMCRAIVNVHGIGATGDN